MGIIEDNPTESVQDEDFPKFDPDLSVDIDSSPTDFEYYICMVANAKALSSGAKNSIITATWPLMEKAVGHRIESVHFLTVEVTRPLNASNIIPGTNIIRDGGETN